VEADGFYDVVQALTADFSTARTPVAVTRFFNLMRKQVTGLTPSAFSELRRVPSSVFEHYETGVDALAELMECRRFFDDREILLNAVRRFIEITFDDLAIVSDKRGWVEKTPANFWRVEFLRELWPESYFVHLIRDPRLMMLSLMEKTWLPHNLTAALHLFEDMIQALVIRRRSLLKLPRVVEVRLEDIESRIELALNRLAAGLELAPFSTQALNDVAATINQYGAEKFRNPTPIIFSEEEAWRINRALMPWILELGYSPEVPRAILFQIGSENMPIS
jgi:hypothetical protein